MMELRPTRLLVALVAVMMIAVACGGGGGAQSPDAQSPGTQSPAGQSPDDMTPAPGSPDVQSPGGESPATGESPTTGESPAGDGSYNIAVSNSIAGNGWREEMICSIRAQAVESGEVAQLNVAHHTVDAAGQLQDIRNLIAGDPDALIVNPASPDALDAALQEAIDQGIVVVAVDQAVTTEGAYLMANNQEEYGYVGAKWLFEHLGGQGDVVYMRGAAGAPADDARHQGWERALSEHPDINVVLETHTGWDQTVGAQQINEFLATGQNFDGVWTSGIDNVIVDALQQANRLVPVVGADNAGFVEQLLTVEGLEGAAVTNPASVGGAGVTLALQILNGETPESQEVLVNPEVWDNTTDTGRTTLEEAMSAHPDLDPNWPLSLTIPDWTTYTAEQIVSCPQDLG